MTPSQIAELQSIREATEEVARSFTKDTGQKLVIPASMAAQLQSYGFNLSFVTVSSPIPPA